MDSLSSGEFLSFLYAERNRELENNKVPGWSKWALWGVIASLTLFIYNICMEHSINLNIVVSYCIIALPLLLGMIDIFFYMRIRVHTSMRVRKLIKESPLSLYIVRFILSVIGLISSILYYINISESLLWAFISIVNLVIIIYIIINRDRLVSARSGNYVFDGKFDLWLSYLMIITYYSIYRIHNMHIEDILFLRYEFEITFAGFVIIMLICKLINISQHYCIADGINYIIECYTGGFINKNEAYKQYLNLLFGHDILAFLKIESDSLQLINDKCDDAIAHLNNLYNSIKTSKSSKESYRIIMKKLNAYGQLCKKCINMRMKLDKHISDAFDMWDKDLTMHKLEDILSSVGRSNALTRILQEKIVLTRRLLKCNHR